MKAKDEAKHYEVWFKGYIEVEAESEEEAVEEAQGLLTTGAVIKLEAPCFPEVLDVVEVDC